MQTSIQTNKQTYKQTKTQVYKQTNSQTHKQKNFKAYIQTYKQTNRQTDKQTNNQAEVLLHLWSALLDGQFEEVRHRLVVALNALEGTKDFAISEN